MIFNYIQPPLPLITPHIEFKLASPPPLPNIMPRIEFNLEQLAHPNGTLGGGGRHWLGNHQFANQEDRGSRGSDQEQDQPPAALSQASPPNKIPKPPGEPGRPGSGGFCMETTLVNTHQWTKEAVSNPSVWEYQILDQGLWFNIDLFKDAVHVEARQTLDMTVSFRSQEKKLIDKICEQVCLTFKGLSVYWTTT